MATPPTASKLCDTVPPTKCTSLGNVFRQLIELFFGKIDHDLFTLDLDLIPRDNTLRPAQTQRTTGSDNDRFDLSFGRYQHSGDFADLFPIGRHNRTILQAAGFR